MKVFIQNGFTLNRINRVFFEDVFEDMLVRHKVTFCATSTDSDHMRVTVYVQEDTPLLLNLPDSDAKVFYNTLSWGTSQPLKFEYIGDMRFNLHI